MHIPVLLEEVIEGLDIKKEGIYWDATGGAGGHSAEILKKMSSKGRLIISDRDPEAVEFLKNKFSGLKNVIILESRFSEIFEKLKEQKINGLNGIVADLGISSRQLDEAHRGLSFKKDEPLDMRLDPRLEINALDIISSYSEEELANVFYFYGEERKSRRIANEIVKIRSQKKIETTGQLKEICEKALGRFYRNQKIHPATRIFQSLRIEVNQELEELKCLLNDVDKLLIQKARLAVIAFHSLEDRMVKRKFQDLKSKGWLWIHKKPIRPTENEIQENPRSRSARLRIIEKNESSQTFS